MKISLITPTHNLKYIPDLYDTIKSQTYDDWEWILYLNGDAKNKASDLPVDLLENDKIRILSDSSNNTNIGYLKNQAFFKATGDILLEMDHDDLLMSTCLEKVHNAFETNPDVGFVYSDNAKLPMKEDFIPYNPACGWTYSKISYKNTELFHMHSFDADAGSMAFIWYMPDHVRAWKKTVYDELGGHDVTLSVLDDQDLLVRTYLKYKFYHISEALYIYRITGDNTWQERNVQIQSDTVEMYYKYAYQLAERDAELNNLLKVDLGGGIDARPGYVTIDQADGDINCDLNNGIPLDTNSVGIINASHVIEHLKDPVQTMREIHRVLVDGGWAMIEVPSTDGRGAWQDPTHVTFWNENSFLYYTDSAQARYIRNTTIKFQAFRVQTHFPSKWWEDKKIPVVTAWLRAIKQPTKRPHYIKI